MAGGIARSGKRLRVHAFPPAEKPRRQHATVVEHQQISPPQELGKLAKAMVAPFGAGAVQEQEAGAVTLRTGVLRDAFRRHLVIELLQAHSSG